MKPYNISHMIMSIGNHKKNYVMKINVVSIFIVLLALTSCVNNSTSKRNKNPKIRKQSQWQSQLQ